VRFRFILPPAGTLQTSFPVTGSKENSRVLSPAEISLGDFSHHATNSPPSRKVTDNLLFPCHSFLSTAPVLVEKADHGAVAIVVEDLEKHGLTRDVGK
jgi:hypothetical protein